MTVKRTLKIILLLLSVFLFALFVKYNAPRGYLD